LKNVTSSLPGMTSRFRKVVTKDKTTQLKQQKKQLQMLELLLSISQLDTPCTACSGAIANIGCHRGSMESRGQRSLDFLNLWSVVDMPLKNVKPMVFALVPNRQANKLFISLDERE